MLLKCRVERYSFLIFLFEAGKAMEGLLKKFLTDASMLHSELEVALTVLEKRGFTMDEIVKKFGETMANDPAFARKLRKEGKNSDMRV